MSRTAAFRQRFARAVERGDPRLGLFVGAAITVLVALAFLRPEVLVIPQRLELTVLDTLGFRLRTPVPESDRIAVIDIDDGTAKKIAWPMKRRYYAKPVLALDHLGAQQIIFDIEFKMTVPVAEDYDPESGEFRLDANDRFLRTAMARSGKVTLAYHIEPQDYLAALRPWSDPLRKAFGRRIGAGSAEVAAETGAPRHLLEEQFEGVREEFVAAMVAERMAANPALTFSELRKECLPDYKPELHAGDLHVLHFAYWLAKARRRMAEMAVPVRVEGLPSKARRWASIVTPAYPFLEAAAGVGCVNADPDADGVMRRPWAVVLLGGVPHAYLGFVAGARGGESLVVRPHELVLRRDGGETAFPIDEEGRILVNWAGNSRRPRVSTFSHVPLIRLVNYYEERYVVLDANVRRTIGLIEEGERQPYHVEYLSLSDRLRPVLEGKEDLGPAEMRRIEARMEEIRRQILGDFENDLRGVEKLLRGLDPSKERTRKNLEKQRADLLAQSAPFRVLEPLEAELRPLVQGRLCIIGSASTASGDLHSSPLGSNTPGVDVPVNVANMALTGNSIRRAPRWVNLVYLLGVGILVSVAVGHWNTTLSAGLTTAVVAGTLGVYALLFSKAALLVTGAGPAVTAVFAFAGVTAFKELVTLRSKRKLQRELEKSTSPELVKIILEHPEILSQPRKMEGTFFFSDVKSFTSISEKMTADVLFPFINRYLDCMTRVLKVRQAYLDKYIGDGIMALFGVPVASPDHARNACRAALECQAALVELNAAFAKEGHPALKTRIGLNSGEVSAGYMGGAERSDYSVLGDAVNLAARLEGANKEYGTGIMLSDSTRRLVGDEFVVRELDLIRVVGKRVPTGIFELVAPKGAPLPFPAGFLPAYAAALASYKARRWEDALEGFRAALALRPGDPPCELYLKRCEAFLAAPPPEGWEGVFELTSK